MNTFLIKNASIVNEGKISKNDVLIKGTFIEKIASSISLEKGEIIDAKGKYLLPGVIDDQVHFREPGLTHKANIKTESKAAVAGGITSFIEMPNTLPQTTSIKRLEKKFEIAKKTSYANYSFMIGGTNNNIEELLKINPKEVAGIKLFLGSSTGNMLVNDTKVLEKIFSSTEKIISVHCEDEATIRKNLKYYQDKFGAKIPIKYHPIIRSHLACIRSSKMAISLAKKTGARLHVFHLSTEEETNFFETNIPLEEKKITAEVCIHHLTFDDSFYSKKGSLIKWNPAIKTKQDKEALWKALNDDRIDVIATDHAPHTLKEKQNDYTSAPSGGPLVQHGLVAMLNFVKDKKITIEKVVQKMCHNPAILFGIEKRGFIKEGFFADLVLVDRDNSWTVSKENLLYKCKWSPFEGMDFCSKITHTFVNGKLIYHNGKFDNKEKGMKLEFNK